MIKVQKEQYTIRIEEASLEKSRIISAKEKRSLNSQIEYFIAKGIEQYEKENSEIILSDT